MVPAVCEELFFRGYLLTSFRSGMSAPLAIAFSGCLFGLFHIIQGLGFERFAPTCFLGLVLGWVCWQTESVLPGMLLHTTHNSLLLIMQTYAKELTAMGIGTELSQHIPTTWLMAAAVAVGVAVTTMIAATQNQTHPGQRAS